MGYALPKDVLYDERFVGMAPEEIYEILKKEEESKNNNKNDSAKPQGSGEAEDEDKAETEDEDENKTKAEDEDETKEEGKDKENKSEGGDEEAEDEDEDGEEAEEEKSSKETKEGGGEDETEEAEDEEGQYGEVRQMKSEDGSELSEAEKSAAEVATKTMIAQAARIAQQAGQMNNGLERIIKELQKTKADWRSELGQYMQESAKNDYTWTTPNKRYIQDDMYLPSMKSADLGEVVLVLDSSGSIHQEMWETFGSEMRSLMEMLNLRLTLIVCDNRIQEIYEDVGADDLATIQPTGGGGTNFIPPFEWVEQNGCEPSLLIYFTDLECSYFPKDPGYQVVWINWKSQDLQNPWTVTPPFGNVINMQ